MATGGPPVTRDKEVDVRYTCCRCMEPYRGRSPKLLPCHHSFCLPCLTALEASVRSAKRDAATDDDPGQKETQTEQAAHPKGEEGEREAAAACEGPEGTRPLKDDAPVGTDDVTASHDDDVDRGSFLCPTCRAPVPIPEGGVATLPSKFYVAHDSDPDEDLPSVLCDMCEDNRQHATHACQECRLRMCRTCRRHHDMVGRDHHVTPVGLGHPAKQKKPEKKGVCLIHQDQVLCFFCRQCDVSICLHCERTSHDGHETVDLVSAAQQAREEITALIPTAQQQLQVMEMSLQQVDRQDRQLTHHAEEVTQQIHVRCDVLMTWARQSRDGLVEEVRAKEACSHGQLQAERASSTLTRHTLSTLLSRAARATTADPDDAVMCRKELKAALLPDDTMDQHRQRADRQGRSCHWGYDVTDAAALLHQDDVTAYMGRVVGVEGGGSEGKRVAVSLRELTDKVERWMKVVTENTHTLTFQLTSCTEDLATLQKKGDDLERKSGELQKKGDDLERKTGELQKKGDNLEKEVERKTTSLQDDITTTSRKTEADLQSLTQSLREKFGKARELFSVDWLDKATTKQDQAMRFEAVVINDGGHYDPHSGVFTAPHAGLYFFTAGVESVKEGISVSGHIMVDKVSHCVVQGGDQGGSGSVMLPLTGGQTVWVEAVSPVSQYRSGRSVWGYECWFKGLLVLSYQ